MKLPERIKCRHVRRLYEALAPSIKLDCQHSVVESSSVRPIWWKFLYIFWMVTVKLLIMRETQGAKSAL